MGPRRTHKKSRDGCQTCKRRRVKCDESGPPCANCIARELDCTYAAPPKPHSESARSETAGDSPSTIHSPGAGSLNASLDPSTRRLIELDLMHTWTSETFKSLMGDRQIKTDSFYWQSYVPKLGLKYDFVLNGLFSLTALHMSVLNEGQDGSSIAHVHAALDYQNAAFATFTRELSRVSQDNASAVFCFSVINFVLSIALPSWSPEVCNDTTTLRSTLGHFRLIKGMGQLVEYSKDWLAKSPFPGLNEKFQLTGLTDKISAADLSALNTLKRIVHEIQGAASTPTAAGEDVDMEDPEAKQAYLARFERPLVWLEECYQRFASGNSQACLTWGAFLDENFLQALSNREPLACLVLLAWTPMLHRLANHVWWARNCGRSLAQELMAVIPQNDPTWRAVISWAREQTGMPTVPISSLSTLAAPTTPHSNVPTWSLDEHMSSHPRVGAPTP